VTDDQGGFRAPIYQRPTPKAVQLAGRRLHRYATEHGVPREQPILEMVLVGLADEVEALARDQRFLSWFTEQLPD
jgi:hypothetical protein